MWWLAETIAELWQRVAATHRPQLMARVVVLAGGLVAMVPLMIMAPAWPLAVIGAVALLVALLLPGSPVGTVWLGVLLVWLLIMGETPPWLVVTTSVGALVGHAGLAAVATTPGFAVVEPRRWRRMVPPSVASLAAVVVATVIAVLAAGLSLPASLTTIGAAVLVLVVVAGIAVWPTGGEEPAPTRREAEPERPVSAWARDDLERR